VKALISLVPVWAWLALAAALSIWYLGARLESVKGERDASSEQAAQASAREASIRSTLSLQRNLYAETQRSNDEYWQRVQIAEGERDKLADDLRNGSSSLQLNATCVPTVRAGTDSKTISSSDGSAPRLNDPALMNCDSST